MNIVALIPARGGSKRIPKKNIKPLGGKPLIQWTIDAARASGIFSAIVVSSDDEETLAIARQTSGLLVYYRRPELATDDAPDILWVRDVLHKLGVQDRHPEAFAILRPTSPFRTAATVQRALSQFEDHPCDSLRAIEPVKQHPLKMWIRQLRTGRIVPYERHEWVFNGVPAHSCPTQTLPPVYAQNASLEIAWTKTVTDTGTIAGSNILPFFTEGWEGFDINTPEDWERAETHAHTLLAGV